MCLLSDSPTCRQVLPLSVDLYTPSPEETSFLMQASPIPA